MMEMIDFIIGLAVGLYIGVAILRHSTKVLESRIKDYEHFANQRINDIHESFARGYETQNGFRPYQKEDNAPETYVMDDETLYEMEQGTVKPQEPTEQDYHQTR